MYYLKPTTQNYAWGSKSFIQDFCDDYSEEIIAELWFGAHPKSPSTIAGQALDELIGAEPIKYLGDESLKELPFLLKILAAAAPLSIQVHPSKEQAKRGFERENKAGIPLDSPLRNYRDANHKPELIMALGPFEALCGIRDYTQILEIFTKSGLDKYLGTFSAFAKEADLKSFSALYQEILSAPLPDLHRAVAKLSELAAFEKELELAKRLLAFYPHDNFVIAPFFMNLLHLNAFDAIYLDAGIPHAYMQGAGVEIMANGDNVLRAGLTPKHIDKKELMAIANLKPYLPHIQKGQPHQNQGHRYKVPVQDFSLSNWLLEDELSLKDIPKPAILLCLEGSLELSDGKETKALKKGEALYLLPAEKELTASGQARFVLAARG